MSTNDFENLNFRFKNAQENLALQAQEDLMNQSNHLRTLIDTLPDYIYFKDINHCFIDANRATVRVMKCHHLEELLGKTDFDFYPEEYARKYFADEREILVNGKDKVDTEEIVIDEEHRARVLHTTKIALKNRAGETIGLVGIGRDVTERKQFEDMLKHDNEMFEKIIMDRTQKLLEMQSEFDKQKRFSDLGKLAAIVAHELRNPLIAINLAVNNARRKFKESPINSYLEIIDKKVSESEEIVSNLLIYSRIRPPQYKEVNLGEILQECIEIAKARSNKNIHFIQDTEKLSKMVLQADPLQMKEVFSNLINNACDVLPESEGTIEIKCMDANHKIILSIKDNGSGIPKENLIKVFEPFFTTKSDGTGLGLPICHQIIDLHNGSIEIDSELGKGTVIQVHLPKNKA